MLDAYEVETGSNPEWSVIWLHGLGADGYDFAMLADEVVDAAWPAVRFVFAHAPIRPVTLNHGMKMRAWYDLVSLDMSNRADEAGVSESIGLVEELIAREAERGVPGQRVFLGGFSQGGAIASELARGYAGDLAGVAVLSAYWPNVSQHRANKGRRLVFVGHGNADPVVAIEWGKANYDELAESGYDVEWHSYPMQHGVCAEEIADLAGWMAKIARVR